MTETTLDLIDDEIDVLDGMVPLAGQDIIELGCGAARLARAVLLLSVITHIWISMSLVMRSAKARSVGYRMKKNTTTSALARPTRRFMKICS